MGKQDSSVKNEWKLSVRLLTLANMVSVGNRLADIGTDHGYIPIWLCKNGRIPSALAMDVREGPLSRAEAHIREYGLTDQIQTRLSDGLEKLGEDEADTVLIAGMGGRLMRRILSDTAVPERVTELVLQPQSDISLIRRWVREHGFRIADEDMVEEDGKFYPMMKAVRAASISGSGAVSNSSEHAPLYLSGAFLGDRSETADIRTPADDQRIGLPEGTAAEQDADTLMDGDLFVGEHRNELDDNFGPILLAKRHPVLQRWLEKELKTTESILAQLEKNSEGSDGGSCCEVDTVDTTGACEILNSRMTTRRQELLHRKELLRTALRFYQ